MRDELFPKVNADGLDIVKMTDSQKYLFDLKGWIALEGLLDQRQLEDICEHQMNFLYDREVLPVEHRDNHGGPSQVLLDHPAVVGVLNEILSHQALSSSDCYGFRFDHTYTSHRKEGHDNFGPHGGGGFFNFRGNSHIYQMQPNRIHSGLTRVVWELNEVSEGDGATLFLSGSHKAAFSCPEDLSRRGSSLWEAYTCPPGSAVIFTEGLCHTGQRWSNSARDRLSLFTCYDTVNSKWGKGCPSAEVIADMPPLRRTLFRGAWHGMGEMPGTNIYYDESNKAV
tara:strand:- start:830 stop:1675 length:846 start_codon:yes stop_codon:yes gene_type:complete